MPKQFVRQVDDLSITLADGTVPVITAAFHVATAQKVNLWIVAPDVRLEEAGSGNYHTTIALSLTLEAPNTAARTATPPQPISGYSGDFGTLSLAFATDSLNLTPGNYLVVAHVGIDQRMRLALPHVYLMVSGSA